MGIDGLAGFFAMIPRITGTSSTGCSTWPTSWPTEFQQHGGDLRLGAPVDKILTKDGAAVGVVYRGVAFEAEVVISACDLQADLPRAPRRSVAHSAVQLEKIRKAAVSEGIFTVYLGLALSNAELNSSLQAYTVAYSPLGLRPRFREPERSGPLQQVRLRPAFPVPHQPGLAPEGKSSLMIQTILPDPLAGQLAQRGPREISGSQGKG